MATAAAFPVLVMTVFLQSIPRTSRQKALYVAGRRLMLWSSDYVMQQGSPPKTKLGVMNTSASGAISEEVWVEALVREAKRDLVFLWHITQGRFGGPVFSLTQVPAVLERVSSALIRRGCIVGYGDPDSPEWRVPTELEIEPANKGAVLGRLWATTPNEYEFLVFALRSSVELA